MKSIYKYALECAAKQNVTMPAGAEILSLQTQYGQPTLWCLVDPEAETEEVTIHIFGTGHEIEDPERLRFLGTFQINEGSLIFHAFVER